jgi:hypothetical protein
LPHFPVFTVPDGPSRLPYWSRGSRSPRRTLPHQAIPYFPLLTPRDVDA